MSTCETCENWIDATAECAVQLKYIANGANVPDSIDAALELSSKAENYCEGYK